MGGNKWIDAAVDKTMCKQTNKQASKRNVYEFGVVVFFFFFNPGKSRARFEQSCSDLFIPPEGGQLFPPTRLASLQHSLTSTHQGSENGLHFALHPDTSDGKQLAASEAQMALHVFFFLNLISDER